MKYTFWIPAFWACFFAWPASAQTPVPGNADFYEAARMKYQKWLDGVGIGKGLNAFSYEIRNDTLLLLFVGCRMGPDSAKAYWDRLSVDYAASAKGEALSAAMFEKIGWYFELPGRRTRLYLTDNDKALPSRCWEARVLPPRGAGGAPVYEEKKYDCGFKSQDFPVVVGPQDMSGARLPAVAEFTKKMDKKAVFQRLKPWLVARFQKPQPDGGWSHIRFSDEWNTLRFEITDLRKEVIDNAESGWLCEVLCRCRTCLPVERIDIKITYTALNDGTGGFELNATVSAMYGSGVFKPGEGGWHDLDDEPAKKALLKKYGERLMYDIKVFLAQS